MDKYCKICGYKLEILKEAGNFNSETGHRKKILIRLCFNKACWEGAGNICDYLRKGHISSVRKIRIGLTIILIMLIIIFTFSHFLNGAFVGITGLMLMFICSLFDNKCSFCKHYFDSPYGGSYP